MTVTMPPTSVLTNLAKTLDRRAMKQFIEHEQIGPMSMTLKLEAMANKYIEASEAKQ